MKMPTKTIVFFASGSGSNVENIVTYFRSKGADIQFYILSNNPEAKVFDRAKTLDVPIELFDRNAFKETGEVLAKIKSWKPDLIVLAGFLWLMPEDIVKEYPNKIINIHPALLPKFGGKGMYGMKVHSAVVEGKEKETGITIHYVNEHYDEGRVILQEFCSIDEFDSPQSVAEKVHQLEYKHLPKVIEKLLFD